MIARARVPASTANLGPGFDVLSVALREPKIIVELKISSEPSTLLRNIGTYGRFVTTNMQLNAGAVALSVLQRDFGKPRSYSLSVRVDIPPSKGLGLSGAEAVGSVLCANKILNLGLDMQQVVEIAAMAEPSHHFDNVAAAALGGFNIITRDELSGMNKVTNIIPPEDLGVAILVPNVTKVSTEATRRILPSRVGREQYVTAMGHASRISAAFANKDTDAILESLPWDPIIEPARANGGAYGKGIDSRYLLEEKKLLFKKYHVAETISGAGPSRALWYSLSEERRLRRKSKRGLIWPAIQLVSKRISCLGFTVQKVYLTKPSATGARIIIS